MAQFVKVPALLASTTTTLLHCDGSPTGIRLVAAMGMET
jgi:hypothetical protein